MAGVGYTPPQCTTGPSRVCRCGGTCNILALARLLKDGYVGVHALNWIITRGGGHVQIEHRWVGYMHLVMTFMGTGCTVALRRGRGVGGPHCEHRLRGAGLWTPVLMLTGVKVWLQEPRNASGRFVPQDERALAAMTLPRRITMGPRTGPPSLTRTFNELHETSPMWHSDSAVARSMVPTDAPTH